MVDCYRYSPLERIVFTSMCDVCSLREICCRPVRGVTARKLELLFGRGFPPLPAFRAETEHRLLEPRKCIAGSRGRGLLVDLFELFRLVCVLPGDGEFNSVTSISRNTRHNRHWRNERAGSTNTHQGERWDCRRQRGRSSSRAGCGGASRGARVTTPGHVHSYHQYQVS